MYTQLKIRKIILNKFAEIQSRNENYSLRSFARFLKISPTTLSEVLSEKRNLSKASCEKVLKKIGVSESEYNDVLSMFERQDALEDRAKISESTYKILNKDEFKIVSDWQHFAILSLFETKNFVFSIDEISRRLSLSLSKVKVALDLLMKLNLLKKEGENIVPTGEMFATTNDIPDKHIRKSHHQTLQLAKRSLEKDDVNERDFIATTMAIDPALIPEAKKLIRKFRNDLASFLETGPQTEVFRLSIQLFPLTTHAQTDQVTQKEEVKKSYG